MTLTCKLLPLIILETLIFRISDRLRLASVLNWETKNISFIGFTDSNGGNDQENRGEEPIGDTK